MIRRSFVVRIVPTTPGLPLATIRQAHPLCIFLSPASIIFFVFTCRFEESAVDMKMSLLVLLLLFNAVMTASSEPVSAVNAFDFFYKFIKDFKVIHEPGHPMFHEGIAYYWYGFYTPSPELPQTCIVLSSHPDWPFDGNVFTNGTVPNAALFGCRQGFMCNGIKCVEQLTHFNVVTYTLTGVIMLLLVCLCGGEPKPKKRPETPRPRRELPRDPSFDNYFFPHRHDRVRSTGPPRYTQ